MGTEYELKFRVDPQTLEAMARDLGPFAAIDMETTYYDTPSAAFSRRRWTLRRRLESGQPVCTLKTPSPDGGRGEWEVPAENIEQALPELVRLGAPEALTSLAAEGLLPRCGARFTRLAALQDLGATTVELALDRGELFAGDRSRPFAEVEVELKSGSRPDAAAYAQVLAAKYALTPEPRSKSARAMALAEG